MQEALRLVPALQRVTVLTTTSTWPFTTIHHAAGSAGTAMSSRARQQLYVAGQQWRAFKEARAGRFAACFVAVEQTEDMQLVERA